MAWKIKFDRDVEKDLRKIDRSAQKKILSYLRNKIACSANPRQIGKPLKGKLSNLWRYRVDHYRIICRIEDKELTLLVVRIGHRKNVYD